MFKFILFIAIVGIAGYFLFQKVQTDKTQNTRLGSNIETQGDSPAALKIIKNITD